MTDDPKNRGRAPRPGSRRVPARRKATAPSHESVDAGDFASSLGGIFELAQRANDDEASRAMLTTRLQRLPREWADKVCILLNLGRAAQERGSVYSSVPVEVSEAQLDVLSLCDEHTRSQQYLERGFAMACADRGDFDQARQAGKSSVFERAWSHFGRELARSDTGEWTWFAERSNRKKAFEKLYLRRGSNGWWSFSAGLDRPLKSQVGTDRSRAAKLRRMDQGSGLHSLVARDCAERPALQRAMRSVHARLGIVSPSR